MKTLYFLRHAKAEPGSKVVSDQERPLALRGQEACLVMGGHMKAKGFLPELAVASPSARTKETLERVAKAAKMAPEQRFDNLLYLASAEEILRFVQETDDTVSSLMVVGHNPGMHHIALLLSDPKTTPLRRLLELKYPTCSLVALRFKVASWKKLEPATGELLDFAAPGDFS